MGIVITKLVNIWAINPYQFSNQHYIYIKKFVNKQPKTLAMKSVLIYSIEHKE